MLDIALAVLNGVLTLVTAYLGVHITMHPAETDKSKRIYKTAFRVCGLAIILLSATQAYRNSQTAGALAAQMRRIESNTKTPPTVQVNVAPAPPAQVVVQSNAPVEPKLEGFAQPYIELLGQDIKAGIGIKMNAGVAAVGIPIKDLHFAPYAGILTAVNEDDSPKTERNLHKIVKKAIRKQKKINADQRLEGIHVSPGVEHPFITTTSPPPTAEQVPGFTNGHTRLYVIVWASWKDENGVSGETEICRRLQTPTSNSLSAQTAVWMACMQ